MFSSQGFLKTLCQASLIGVIGCSGLNFLCQPASAESETEKIVNAYYNAGNGYCDAQMLATVWQTTPYNAKITAGKMILGYRAFPGSVPAKLSAVRREYAGRGICNFSSDFSYEDAVALAAYWKTSVATAKASLTRKLESGNLPLAKRVVKEARKSAQNPTQTQSGSYDTLSTLFTGKDKCLDIVNDGANNQLAMADCGNFSGQRWKIVPSKSNPGTYRLSTLFTGKDKCLDVVNDGTNNQLTMANCGKFTGQYWKILSSKRHPDTYRLTNLFTGKDKCLDIVNDGTNNRITMANCGDFSGQYWRKIATP
jgi:Ricin-type beta-trefoil lectin domain